MKCKICRSGIALMLLMVLVMMVFPSCDDFFIYDGNAEKGITDKGGKFYLLDKQNAQLVMLSRTLETETIWDLQSLSNDGSSASLQGITYDDEFLWISISGNDDIIMKVDNDSDSLIVLNSFQAPPTGKGVVRDLAYDGRRLWAINSGSATYSLPPVLYELDASNGTVLAEYQIPVPEPRGMCYVAPNSYVYGRSIPEGLYFTDKDVDKMLRFRLDKRMFEEFIEISDPPRGEFYNYAIGLSHDGEHFWLVNSSGPSDLLNQIDYAGKVLNTYELPFDYPGPVVWADRDITMPQPPEVFSLTPNVAILNQVTDIVINGKGFSDAGTISVAFNDDGITVQSINYVDENNLEISVLVAESVASASYDITVTNPDGQSALLNDALYISDYDPSTGYIWVSDYSADILYKIKISDESIVAQFDILTIAPGGSPQGLDFDGTNYWMSAGGTDDAIMQFSISGQDLAVDISLPAPPEKVGTVREIFVDDVNIWAINDTYDSIYKLSKSDGTMLDTIPTPGIEPRGLVMAGGDLYCNDKTSDSVYVYIEDELKWSSVFAVPVPPGGTTSNRFPTGMTFDGINFWLANSSYEFDYIYQIDLRGNVVRTIAVPNQGSAQATGLMFTKN